MDTTNFIIKNYKDLFITYLVNEHAAPATIEKHEYYLKNAIIPSIGTLEPQELTRLHMGEIRRFSRDAFEGATSEYKMICTLRRFLRYIQEHHIKLAFDWRDITLPKRGVLKDPESLSHEEICFIFNQLDLTNFYDLRLRLHLEMLFRGGLRPSEPLSLNRTTDIDIEKERFYVRNVKSGEYDWITMRGIKPILEKYLGMRKDDHEALFIGGKHMWESAWLDFQGAKSHLIRFKKRLKKKGFYKKFTFYILRKSFCTQMLERGMDIKDLQVNARHADPSTTLRYYVSVNRQRAKDKKSEIMQEITFPMFATQ